MIGYDGGKKVKGRKRHILVDTNGFLLEVLLTTANVQDRRGALALLEETPRPSTVEVLFADRGYSGPLVQQAVEEWGCRFEPVPRESGRWLAPGEAPPTRKTGFIVQKWRWIVERTFGWISRQRRCARDYEEDTTSSRAWIFIAMSTIMLRRIVR